VHSGSVQSRMLHCNRLCRSGLSADSVRMDFVRCVCAVCVCVCVCVCARRASAAGAFLLKIAQDYGLVGSGRARGIKHASQVWLSVCFL